MEHLPAQETQNPSVHLTLYGYGDVHPLSLMSWVGLTAELAKSSEWKGDLRLVREDALISRSRCRATKWFLDSGSDVWIQIDHDIEFQPEDILELARIAHVRQAVVCIPYSCRALPPKPALRVKPGAKPLADDERLTPITLFASGCVAIPRELLEHCLEELSKAETDLPIGVQWCDDSLTGGQIPTLWMPFAAEVRDRLEYLSEDYAASYRLAACGAEQFAFDPKTPLKHWGDFPFRMAGVEVKN